MGAAVAPWPVQRMGEGVLNGLISRGLLKPNGTYAEWIVAKGLQPPDPPDGYVVSVANFHNRRFGMPAHPFFRGLLHYYQVELHHLDPDSIGHIAGFITMCEAYLGNDPHFNLWRYFFRVRHSRLVERGRPSMETPIGCASIRLRQNRMHNYIPYISMSSDIRWRSNWFYIRNNPDGLLPPFSGRYIEKAPHSWRKDLGSADVDYIRPLINDVGALRTSGVSWAGVIGHFHVARVLPLMRRSLRLWELTPEANRGGTAMVQDVGLSFSEVSARLAEASGKSSLCHTDAEFEYPIRGHPRALLSPGVHSYANLVQTPSHPPLPKDLHQQEVVRVRYERGESSRGVTRAADDPGVGGLSEEVWTGLLLEDDDDVDDPLPEPDEVGAIPRVSPDPVGEVARVDAATGGLGAFGSGDSSAAISRSTEGDEMSVIPALRDPMTAPLAGQDQVGAARVPEGWTGRNIPDTAGRVVLQAGMVGGESAGLGRSQGTERSGEASVRLEWGPDFWEIVRLVRQQARACSPGVSSVRSSLESALHVLEETRPPFEGERLRHRSSERAVAAQAVVTAEASRADLLKKKEALRRRADDAEASLGTSQERAGDAERRGASLAAEVKAKRELREVAEVAFANLSSELAQLRDQNGVLEQELVESQAVVGELDNLRLAFLHSCSQLGMKVTNHLHETTRQVLALPTHVRALEENAMEGKIRLSFAVVRSHYEPDVGVELMSEGFAEGASLDTLAAFEEEVRPDAERLLAKYKEEFLLRPLVAED
ncbi:hypothetical protein EJB05_37003, partial [Eragrostis curvula]